AENQTGSGPVLELSESQGLVEVIEPAAGFRVLTHTLPTGREGVAYPRIQILTAGVTTGGLTFSLSGTSGPLPPGITLDPQGFLSGTPTEAGTFPIVVQIVNTATLFAAYDLIIDPGLPFGILRGTLSTGVVGVPYHETLDAYGPAATAWSDAGSATTFASLGLSLASGTGVVSGTPTAAPNAYVVVVTATATGHTSVRAVSIQIAQTAVTAQYFATPGVVGATYSDTIQAFGGTPPYAFALVPGESLPPGLALGGAGALSGTPTATTPFGGPLVAITDSTPVTPRTGFGQLLLIVLDPLAPALGLPSSVDSISGTVGTAMTFTPAPYGGTTPYTLAHETTSPPAVTADGLPPGLTLGAGSITGTPTASGLYPFTLKVTDNSTPNKVIDAQLLFEIQPSGTPGVLGIETMQIPNGVHTANYPATQLLLVTNGVAGPFAWSLTGAPGTLTVAAGTGVVSSSSPLAAGTYYFNVTATKAPATATGRVKVVIQ
ncbi:MAG TPA: Ig domain-containing protein, partial [Planctomycetota bacterium]|nr:Ig domain-containing protein [Planctomycetota bacterium]